ncbi:MAG: hypothetical protein AABN95_18395 [Acidobacteriota bacterium]
MKNTLVLICNSLLVSSGLSGLGGLLSSINRGVQQEEIRSTKSHKMTLTPFRVGLCGFVDRLFS